MIAYHKHGQNYAAFMTRQPQLWLAANGPCQLSFLSETQPMYDPRGGNVKQHWGYMIKSEQPIVQMV